MATMPHDFTAASTEDFIAGAGWLTGNIDVKFRKAGAMGFTTAAFGKCSLHNCMTPPFDAAAPRRLEYAGMSEPICFYFQLSGIAEFRMQGLTQTLYPKSVAIYGRSHPVDFSSATGSRHLALNLPGHLLPLSIRRRATDLTVMDTGTPGIPSIFRKFVLSAFEQRKALDPAARSNLERIIVGLAADAMAFSAKDDDCAGPLGLATLRTRAMGFIETHLDKLESVEELASKMGCSARYLYKAFDQRGVTPARYIWSLRLDRARERIVTAGKETSIAEIAFGCGFASYAHFSRAFKHRFGVTPQQLWNKRGQTAAKPASPSPDRPLRSPRAPA